MRRAAVLAALLLVALLLRGCGGDALVTEQAGTGPGTVTVIRPEGLEEDVPVVLFLHGWGATEPRVYRPWLDHLAEQGNAVIYPRYQDSFAEPPAQVLGNVILGVRLALERLDEDPFSLVVAGHSAGGALAEDYAAVAGSVGLPPPLAVFAAYPGRRFRGASFGLPRAGAAPPEVAVRVLVGARDEVVDQGAARRMAAGGGEHSLEVIRDPAAADHLGPQRADAAARRVFWRRLDALIATVREAETSD